MTAKKQKCSIERPHSPKRRQQQEQQQQRQHNIAGIKNRQCEN